MYKVLIVIVMAAAAFPCAGQATPRRFDVIFPRLSAEQRDEVFSSQGLVNFTRRPVSLQYLPTSQLDKSIGEPVQQKNPSIIVEVLTVIPDTTIDFLKVYNTVSNIRNLSDPNYYAITVNSVKRGLFLEASRIQNASRKVDIPDPPRAPKVPVQETLYIRLKEKNFGNNFFRIDISATSRQFLYTITNVSAMSFLVLPIIWSGNISIQLYFERVTEGMMVYSIAGAEIAEFFFSMFDVPTMLKNRTRSIMRWVTRGLVN
ncbi:hypothetical protein FACS1894172_19590 [Spirochaetia bacterium]|nr:hypothetical protein FACS1894172_19590 [Spirochaetia bacterium]